jgi:hypothetical protein
MTAKALFSQSEWGTLKFSVLWVFHAIAEVDGIIDEAEGTALLDAFQGKLYFHNEILKEILADIAPDTQALIDAFKKDERGIPMGLKETAELVEKKLDAAAATDFKRTLLFLGVTFAKASGEVESKNARSRLSEMERAAILTVAAILRLSLTDLAI